MTKRTNLEIVSTGVAAIGVTSTLYFGFKSYGFEKQLAEMQLNVSSFDAAYSDSSLELRVDGSVFSEPERLVVLPIFSSQEHPVLLGQEVALPIDSGATIPDKNIIRFNQILDRLCEYPVNAELCVEQGVTLKLLRVTYSINGRSDTDEVLIAG